MRSAIAITYEMDNIPAAAKELTSQIKGKLTLGKNTAAILHGQSDMNIGELANVVSRELGCPVIGGTTSQSSLLTNDGYHELAVTLHVLTADDCLFATAISAPLTDSPGEAIEAAYRQAYQNLKEQDAAAEPKMIFCVASIVQSIDSDGILSKISELCGNLPVFGYNAGDEMEFCKQQVYLDGISGGDRLAIMMVAGNVRPIFQTVNLAGRRLIEKRLITKARGNVICEIDGRPAFDYIKEFPFIDSETTGLVNYQFFVEMQSDIYNDGVPVSRVLNSYDKETGEITCFAAVPENSYIGLLYCDGTDVSATTEDGIKKLLEKLKAAGDDYEYSTVVIASCNLRLMFLADLKESEGKLINKLFPSDLTVSGLYVYGEMAPTSVKGDRAVNRFHNATCAFCAF